ncbi:DUF6755 family protein [Pyrinomonas methylaliphatogenes]|uniref:Uncharacterized protein n=1 Tax=Pyrinomonas methylaliphatogenes TaxID=454194 RepID=A0A0B6WXD6_9BACT|nr:DUF6755 family protein [Pyrinomonas methylaliphatogenes]CDM64949.1 hypothetical protein PYK22_00945 [Pyrinomonas methylaliphatogenes]
MASRLAKVGVSSRGSLRLRSRRLAGRAAVEQARLILLVMINIAQLWILSATVEASLAARFDLLLPLVISSAICFFIALSVLLWWRPTLMGSEKDGPLNEGALI